MSSIKKILTMPTRHTIQAARKVSPGWLNNDMSNLSRNVFGESQTAYMGAGKKISSDPYAGYGASAAQQTMATAEKLRRPKTAAGSTLLSNSDRLGG